MYIECRYNIKYIHINCVTCRRIKTVGMCLKIVQSLAYYVSTYCMIPSHEEQKNCLKSQNQL